MVLTHEGLTSDPSCEVHVLAHDGDSSCMNCAEVDVLKETNYIGLGCLLQSTKCGCLESEVGIVVPG